MRQTCILIISALNTDADLEQVKESVKSFVGLRSLDEDQPDENAPLVMVNGLLSKEDKEKLSKMYPTDSVGFAFIEAEKATFEVDRKDYINATLKP